jgi:hypothetical protein
LRGWTDDLEDARQKGESPAYGVVVGEYKLRDGLARREGSDGILGAVESDHMLLITLPLDATGAGHLD